MSRLESALRETAGAENSLRSREAAEKSVGLELKEENVKLREEIRTWEEKQLNYQVNKISDHIFIDASHRPSFKKLILMNTCSLPEPKAARKYSNIL